MTVELSRLPHSRQTQVREQRYFVQALSTALTGREERSMADQAEELRGVAANVMLALQDVRYHARNGDWQDCARIAAIQSLAAAAGASLLDDAVSALRGGEHQRLEFAAQTRGTLGIAQPAASPPSTPATRTPAETPAPSQATPPTQAG